MVSSLLQHADAFKWQRGVTPLSDERLMLVVPGAYVAVVLLLRAALGGRTVPLGPLPALHNCVLMLWSLAMFAGTALEAWRLSAGGAGAEWLFCLAPGTAVAGRLYWWSYVYYLSKARAARSVRPPRPRGRAFRVAASRARPAAISRAQYYELLDTVLRVLKAQPLTFLHVFHHAVVLVMAYGVRSPRHAALIPRSRRATCRNERSGWNSRSRCR
jgi:fatty acid elongase 3